MDSRPLSVSSIPPSIFKEPRVTDLTVPQKLQVSADRHGRFSDGYGTLHQTILLEGVPDPINTSPQTLEAIQMDENGYGL